MKQDKLIVREKLVVGYWDFIPMESRAELLAPQDIYTVRFSEERQVEKKQRNYWMDGEEMDKAERSFGE